MSRWMIWVAIGLVVIAITAGSVVYTDQPSFCPTCHEMVPYHDAWTQGGHKGVSCLDCHVEPGVVNGFLHKFVALREVWDHFTTKPIFPRYDAEVPDHRCTACHEVVDPGGIPGFSHPDHASAGTCQECHPSVGHAVTFQALQDAGVLDTTKVTGQLTDVTGVLKTADPTPQLPKGHADVTCASCHDMTAQECSYCHTPPDNHFTDAKCSDCHTPGTPFKDAKFNHTGNLNCADCHKAPANHFSGAACTTCHTPSVPFKQTVFRHPSTGEHSPTSMPCTNCHPNGFGSATCTKCHANGAPTDD